MHGKMHKASLARCFYLSWLSQPRSERLVYRYASRLRVSSIVEIGIGSLHRTENLIELAARHASDGRVRYTGLDPFETRPPGLDRLSLIESHRRLKPTGAALKLVPGEVAAALARTANGLADIDLVLISAAVNRVSFDRICYYLPRMLHSQSVVFREQAAETGLPSFRAVPRGEIDRFGQAPQPDYRRAA